MHCIFDWAVVERNLSVAGFERAVTTVQDKQVVNVIIVVNIVVIIVVIMLVSFKSDFLTSSRCGGRRLEFQDLQFLSAKGILSPLRYLFSQYQPCRHT